MSDKELIKSAESVVRHRKLAEGNTAGGVGAALVTVEGNIYKGVCIDTGSGMGFCAEAAAIGAMITAGESKISKIVALWKDENNKLYILPPCGRCREFMTQIDDNLNADVILGKHMQKLKTLLIMNGRSHSMA